MSALHIDFCGEEYVIAPGKSFSIGRDADLVVDPDNAYLHRRTAELVHEHGLWWLVNVGTRLPITVSGEAGTLQSWVGPGTRLPLVLADVSVLFTAGETTYEVELHQEAAGYESVVITESATGEVTLGTVDLTPSQFLLILALSERTLRRAGNGPSAIPSNIEAAQRLGWSITTFNRKLDNVCDKFSRAGVKGLHGEPGRVAQHRRARLVEYSVSSRVVRPDHLPLLERVADTEVSS